MRLPELINLFRVIATAIQAAFRVFRDSLKGPK